MSNTPFPAQEEALVPGANLISVLDFAETMGGAGEREALFMRLPAADAAVVRVAQPVGWYPLALRGRLIREICGGRPDVARQIGHFEAARDLAGRRRCFFSVVPPDVAVRDMNVFWRDTQTSGVWTSEVKDGGIVARLEDWQADEPLLCDCLAGHLECVLGRLGGGTPVVVRHPQCRAKRDAHCEFKTTFSLAAAPAPGAATGNVPCDLPALLGQLTSIGDLDRVADATVALFQRLAFSYVTLRIRQPSLTRSSGAPGDGVLHRFPLKNGGHMIGWIELGDADGSADFARVDEPLLSHLAVALHGCGICPELALQNRRKSWTLTAREFEVLVLVVRGYTNKAISREISLSEPRVEALLTSLFRRAGIVDGGGGGSGRRSALIVAALNPQTPNPGAERGRRRR